jgi:adenosine deaminase
MVDGLIDGVRAADEQLGVRCGLIASINRAYAPAAARELVELMLRHQRDEVIGLGLDALTPDAQEAPERFADAFALARSGGLHRTAHVAENADAPARNVVTALDVLGVERIDHGYQVLRDPAVLERARDEGVVFCCSTSATLPIPAPAYGPGDLLANPIRAMVDAGLRVTLGTDGMPGVTPADEYEVAAVGMALEPAEAVRMVLDGVDATWLDDGDKRRLRAEIEAS